MSTKLAEKKTELRDARQKLADIFAATKTESGDYALDAAQTDQVKGLMDAVDKLGREVDDLDAIHRAADHNQKALAAMGKPHRPVPMGDGAGLMEGPYGPYGPYGPAVKSIGDLIVESDAYKAFQGRPEKSGLTVDLPDFNVKTLFQTSAGWSPESLRRPGAIMSPQETYSITDLMPAYPTSQASVKYMLETTFTGAATEIAEAGTYPEATFALTETTESVRKIAVTIPATDEQLDDVDGSREYLSNRLSLAARQRLASQCINGDAVSPNLRGLLNVSNINSQAKGSDTNLDAIHKAITLVRTNGFTDPTAIVLNPSDWEKIRLVKTTDGIYIMGNPTDAIVPRLWGLPVALTTHLAAGTGLTADFRGYVEIWYRKGLTFKVTDSHASEFLEGKQRVRADIRAALVVTRAKAVAKVTGIA